MKRLLLFLLIASSLFAEQKNQTDENANNHRIYGVPYPPPNSNDVTTKQYVDSLIGTGVIWGAITGTLSNQTDLQSALNSKQSALTFTQSITNTGGTVKLTNDSASPGNSKYYGTDVSGTLGYFNLPNSAVWGSITGTLSSQTDLQTALNSKQNTLTIGNLTDTGTDGITVVGGTGSVIGSGTSLSQHVSDSTHNGYLSSTDWSTFNGKQSALTLGTGVATALGVNVGTTGAFVVNGGALGTPSSGTLTNATGLPESGIVWTDPNANTIRMWDDTDNAMVNATIGSNLTYTHSTHTISATGGGSIEVTNSILMGDNAGGAIASHYTNDGYFEIDQNGLTQIVSANNDSGSSARASLSAYTDAGGIDIVTWSSAASANTSIASSNSLDIRGTGDLNLIAFGGNYKLSNFFTNGFVTTSAGNGTLLIDTTSYVPQSRQLTIGPTTLDLSSDRTFLGNVTNDIQTKASIYANTAPTSGQIPVGDTTQFKPKTVSGSGATITMDNTGLITISGIVNASLQNSGITISGTSTALGGTISRDTITGVSSNGIYERTAANTYTTVTAPAGAVVGTTDSQALTNKDLTGTGNTFPTFNQNTTGSAASLSVSGQTGLLTVTGLTSVNRAKTVRDAADTLLELGGSYTPTGTWTSLTMVTPVLGTPTSGTLSNCTSFPGASLTLTDVTTNDSSTSNHGFLKKLDNVSTHYMNGQGNWSTASATLASHNLWGQAFNGTADVTGSLTSVGDITGGASNMTITAGTGNSRTMTLRSTTSGGTATAFLTGNADQSSTFGGNISGTGAWSLTGGAGNMTITAGTGNSRTLTLQSTTSGGTATNGLVIDASQHITLEGVTSTGATGTGKFVFDTSPNITTGFTIGGSAATAGTLVASDGTRNVQGEGTQLRADGTSSSGTNATLICEINASANHQLIGFTAVTNQVSATNTASRIIITYSDSTTISSTSSATSTQNVFATPGGIMIMGGSANTYVAGLNKIVTGVRCETSGSGTSARNGIIAAIQVPR